MQRNNNRVKGANATDANQLQYQFVFPQDSRSTPQICMINNTNTSVTIDSFQIVTNANIESPWSVFGDQWDNVTVTQNGQFYTYTLNFTTPVSIPPGSTPVLTYSITQDKNLGPIPSVPMIPQQIEVKQANQGWQNVQSVNAANPQPNPHPKIKDTMYHAEWGQYAYKKNATNEEWQDVNSLSYAFNGFDVNGNVMSLDPWADQYELPMLALQKQARPYLDFSLSYGGWTNNNVPMAPIFSQLAANPAARAKFVANVVATLIQTGANAVDIDWEYVETADAENYIALLTELRTAMKAANIPNAKVTTTAPAGIDKINNLSADQWQRVSNVVDELRVMAYDFFGGFSQYCDFHAPWQLSQNSPDYKSGYDTKTALDAYLDVKKVPAEKLSLGLPNYSRAVIVDSLGTTGTGLYQPVVGTPQGDFQGANGIYSWKNIFNLLNNQPSAFDELGVKNWNFYDETHPFCQDAQMCLLVGELPNGQYVVVNFLRPENAAWRAQKAVQSNFGGVMMWANYFETDDAKNSISNAVSNALLPNSPKKIATSLISDSQKQAVKDHVASIKNATFAGGKAAVLKQLHELASNNQYSKMQTVFDDNKKILKQQRNIFKRILSAFGVKFAEPKSLALAKDLMASAKSVKNSLLPTGTIKNDRALAFSAVTPRKTVDTMRAEQIQAEKDRADLIASERAKQMQAQQELAKGIETEGRRKMEESKLRTKLGLNSNPYMPPGFQAPSNVSTLSMFNANTANNRTNNTANTANTAKNVPPQFGESMIPSNFQRNTGKGI